MDTLIADAVNIYDLKNPDDQLLLGIKGTLSVMELSILKQRMLKGQEEKAKRGELHKLLTPGYIYDKSEDEGIEVPVNKFSQIVRGERKIEWQLSPLSYISGLLENPFYAGAYRKRDSM